MSATPGGERAREQSRARYPDVAGTVERDGVRLGYEVYGDGEPTVLLLPTWSIVHSRHWKAQIPYLSRHARVVAFDGRGNGRSDRPQEPAAYDARELAADALAVLDVTETSRAVLVFLSLGSQQALLLAAEHPGRVAGAFFVGPSLPITPGHPGRGRWSRGRARHRRGMGQVQRALLAARLPRLPRVLLRPVPAGAALQQAARGLHRLGSRHRCRDADRHRAPPWLEPAEIAELTAGVRCPVLVVHGDDDRISPLSRGAAVAEQTGGTLVALEGSGHLPHARDPVKVNLLLRDFACPPPPRRWTTARNRRKRALFVSSPIGLGHAQRDVAIADELRKVHPDLEIDWLAQHPVTRVLEAEGERIHLASAHLSNESRHIESESAEHDLHCFRAWRRMDEILVANFMVFTDVVRDEPYDLWIGDEAWELDHFLHENPELKTAPYVWLTDFVGWLPMLDGGAHEAALTADYNAEMIEHIARYPRLRDRSVSSATPTTSSRTASAATCRSSGRGPRSTTTSPATSPASTRRRSPTATHCARNSATSRTRRCASSPSAAPESGRRCCAGWSRRSRTPSGSCRRCGWWW